MGDFVKEVFWESWFARYLLRPVVILYLLFMLFAYAFSDALIHCPRAANYTDSKEIIKLRTADGARISAQYFPNLEANYLILYSHGNGEDLGDDAKLLTDLRDLGYAVFAYDYHGYGTSGGKPCEKALYQDIDAAYAYVTRKMNIPPDRIIIYGRSLGGGPSIDLASRKPAAGLILQSAFTSAFRTVTRVQLLPFDKYRNIDKIGKVQCPVLVMHGDDDHVIPFEHGKALYAAVKSPKMSYWVPDADHNNFRETAGDQCSATLAEFTNLIESKRNHSLH